MDSGLYQIVLRTRRKVRVAVGRLGAMTLPAGWYVYTGRAGRGLGARVARHVRREKRVHWHVDALTTHPDVAVVAAWRYPAPLQVTECELHRATVALPGATVPVRGFGASDCEERCDAHLVAFPAPPRLPPPDVRFARVERGQE